MFMVSRNLSNAWKGICENKSILDKGIMHSLGYGQQTLFWRHRRALEQPLMRWQFGLCPSTDQNQTVAEYWQLGLGWRWDDFEALLPRDILERIRAIQVYPDARIQDELFWGKTSLGLFSMQSR